MWTFSLYIHGYKMINPPEKPFGGGEMLDNERKHLYNWVLDANPKIALEIVHHARLVFDKKRF